jgi:hypothetical protein
MQTATSLPTAAIRSPIGVQPGLVNGAGAPQATPTEAAGVAVSLSPEALAVLQGALSPQAATDAARAEAAAINPMPAIAAGSPIGADAIFELYGQVDINGDGDPDGPAGAVNPDAVQDPTGNPLAAAEDASAAQDEEDPTGNGLSPEEQAEVAELRSRDAEVRAHEAAHMAAGGGLAGGASFTYQTGPDGKRYAVGGEVSINTSGGNTPEETLSRAQRIRAAALAPADPSGQDRAVAAMAGQMEAQARVQLARERMEEIEEMQGGEAENEDAAPVSGAEGPVGEDATDAPRTLAGFDFGSAAQANLFGLPESQGSPVQGPIDAQDRVFTLFG